MLDGKEKNICAEIIVLLALNLEGEKTTTTTTKQFWASTFY